MSKSNDKALSFVDPDDIGYNDTKNDHFSTILDARLSRRSLLRGGAASIASAFVGSSMLTACGGSDTMEAAPPRNRLRRLRRASRIVLK